ncbi:hypothetical protein Mapa_011005 [Marchantia paleacea]|nr:hypothetical protein Mapa_011005 [Marchantia paleacea]
MFEMKQLMLSTFCAGIIFLSTLNFSTVSSETLSVSSRWIVDQSGARVKLACVNWAGHLEPMLPEGLDKQPISNITDLIVSSGFNCVRLTWATYMFTRPESGGQTVGQSLSSLGLQAALDGVSNHNPNFTQLTLTDAYTEVVTELGKKGLMIILDNHVSKPGWCCGYSDGNGFWGDQFFDPAEWLTGLEAAANLSLDHKNVIGIGLRNEPRGPRSNPSDWRKNMASGAETVHMVNDNLLVCAGGLSFSADLSFLYREPLTFSTSSIRQKLVYELHWYSWYSGLPYGSGNLNQICSSDMKRVMDAVGFLLTPDQAYTSPVLVSEFGLDQGGRDPTGNRFFDCFMTFAAKLDMDYALWALQGSYYQRNGVRDLDETFGVLTHTWDAVRNPGFVQRLGALKYPLPGSVTSGFTTYSALFHPATGLCVSPRANTSLALSACGCGSSVWSYDASRLMIIFSERSVISAPGEGFPAVVTHDAGCKGCQWTFVGNAELQLQSQVGNKLLCLDGTSGTDVTAETCLCLESSQCVNSAQVPTSQWFQFFTVQSSKTENRSRQHDTVFDSQSSEGMRHEEL